MGQQRPVVLLTGARQTGKTSLLKKLFPSYGYVSLDLPRLAEEAEESGSLFLEKYPPPTINGPKLLPSRRRALVRWKNDWDPTASWGRRSSPQYAGVGRLRGKTSPFKTALISRQ
ncbi:MAG: AAA family ATPase [Deltaproteobacteria bacterium]|nr:AAA family ATPase [Deltaproteobacteria bacterium]